MCSAGSVFSKLGHFNSQAYHIVAEAGRAGGGGSIASLIGMSTKMQNKKSTTFLALLRLFYALECIT